MKSFSEIYNSLKNKFFALSRKNVEENTVLDMFFISSSEGIEEAYKKIEENKTPHIYTGLRGIDLDRLGVLVECFRENEESDDSYLYRIMTSRRRGEASNEIAINTSLISLRYSSNATYVPLTNGCGTGTVYIVPVDYEEETQQKAIEEVHERISLVVCPSSYIEYIIPEPISISFTFYMATNNADVELTKRLIEQDIRSLVNGIAPGAYLNIGDINRIGVNQNNVNYFQVSEVKIDGVAVNDKKIMQKRETKLILDEIIWWDSEA